MIGVVTTIKQGFTLWPVTCAVTGDQIPIFTKAVRRWIEYPVGDEIYTEFCWISKKGYTFIKLQGWKEKEGNFTDDPGPW